MKLSVKLITGVGLIAVAVIGALALFTQDLHRRQLVRVLEEHANQLSETVKSSTRHDMMLDQRDSVHSIIRTIGRQEGIERVRIFNKEGRIIFSTDERDVGRMVDKRAEACYACHAADLPLDHLDIAERTRIFPQEGRGRTLGIINPIYNERGCWASGCHASQKDHSVLGVLDVTMSLAGVDRDLGESRLRLVLFALVAVASISLIIAFMINRMVLKPVKRIIAATHRLGEGDLTVSAAPGGKDEIGLLARSFDEMVRRLGDIQTQLTRSEKLASIGRLAAGVAHEINNPLTGVLTYSSFLLKRAGDDPQLREDLDVVVRETNRCREIVKGLLDFSRQSTPNMTRVSLDGIVARAVGIVRNQLALGGVRLDASIPAALPELDADANQIQQVLVNLLLNANDALGERGGVIELRAEATREAGQAGGQDGNWIRLRIIDNGCGIPEADLPRIFDPFFTTKGQKGTGLGLAVAWGIVEKHGGRLQVESSVGRGTTFTLLLPAAAPGTEP